MKPQIVAITLLMLFSLSVLGNALNSSATMIFQPTRARKQESITFATFISRPYFSNIHGYDVMRIQDCGMTTKVGEPTVPVKIVPVLLPPNADVKNIELTSSEKENLPGNYKIFPAQHPTIDIESELPKFVKPDPAVYKSDRAYPGILFENIGIQWMEGYKILNIRIFPIQYFPGEGKITYYKTMKFTVTFTSNGLPPSKNTASNTKKTISTIVANPEKTEVWLAPSRKPISSPTIDYVIITSPSLEDEFQELADWKIESGISAQVYNTTWIYNNYAGADNQEKIRNFIIEMHDNHAASMVLLGGDYNIIPPRYIYMEDCLSYSSEAGGGLTAHYKPTDYYYACLDGDWDPDHDGRYLEQTDMDSDDSPETCVEPIPDFYPEVYVGRMPATSETTAEFLVNRTINYEKNPQPGDWKNKTLLLGAISNYQNEDNKGWYKTDDAKEQEWVKNNLLGEYDVITMYEKDGLSPSTYTCTYPLTQNNVQTSLSSGCWIMSTAGHGSVQEQWRKIWNWDDWDGVPESYEMSWLSFIDSTAVTLSNSEQLPQVYMDACLNGKFDDISNDCLAEWLVKLNGGGAIGVTASSRISYYCIGWEKGWPWNQELLCLFWQEFFNATNEYRPGKALYESKLAYYLEGFDMTNYASKKDLLIYNLLGDPDLRKTVTYTQPEISILSPENTTYTTSAIPLTFTVNKATSWIGYSLHSQTNVTITGNTTLTDLSEGTHNLIVYANDTAGNMGYSNTVYFTVNLEMQFNFDFGTDSSPVETGYTKITPSTLSSISSDYGWNSSTELGSRDRGSPDNLRRDLMFSSVDQTFKVDVTNGAYVVMVIAGDQAYMHDNIRVYAEDVLKSTVSTGVGEFVQKVFVVSVADGTLDLMFQDEGGSDSNWVINAIRIKPYSESKFDFGTEGSPVESGYTQVLTSTSYSGSTGYGWADTVDLYARDRGAPDSLRRDFVFSSSNKTFNIDLPNGKYMVVLIIGDNSYSHDRIDIYCEGTLVVNDLCVEKGYFAEVAFLAEVSDAQLGIMFCDDGGANAHWVVNAIHAKTTFDLRLEFDFGTSSCPVQDGYVRITPATAYLPSTSYGWSDITDLWSRDRGAPDALRRDLVFSDVNHTFKVDLSNHKYQVTLIVGDQNHMHDKIDIYAEDALVADDITTSAGTFTEIIFTVTVNDGQLNVSFHDDGGPDSNWVINSVVIESYQEDLDTMPPTITITSPEEGATLSSADVTVTWTGSDAGSGIDYYEVRMDGGSWVEKGTSTSHTFTSLSDDEHTADVRAWDNAGSNTTDSVTFTVDTSGPPPKVVKWAVIVGISDYKAINDLSYCDEDATDWYNHLSGTMDYDCIWVYGDGHSGNYPQYDGYATEYNVKQALQNVVNQADSDDIIVFTTSGHGSGNDLGSSYLCMWDCGSGENGEDGDLWDTELANILDDAVASRVFVFIDHCLSGGFGDDLMNMGNSDHVYLTTTCTENGYGWDDSAHENGLWTYYFLEYAWINHFGADPNVSMEDVFDYAHDHYPYGGDHEPQEYDGDSANPFYLT